MKAGVALDDWKLPVFRKRLTEAGFEYTDAGEITPGVTLLHVHTNDMMKLKGVLEDAADECKRQGKPKP